MLRDALAPRYEEKARPLLKEPWAARDGYIDVILDRGQDKVSRFFDKYASHALNDDEKVIAILQKTWKKMSERGHETALKLAPALPADLLAVVQKAITTA